MMIRSFSVGVSVLSVMIAVGITACQSLPKIRSESAPGVNFAEYHTYSYYDQLSTDRHGYKSITTRTLQDAIDREMRVRGFVRAANGDLKVNFNIANRDKVTTFPGPAFNAGFGGWRGGYGWGLGYGGRADIETVTEGTLTVDLVDASKGELVWTGAAVRILDSKALDQPRQAIDQAVNLIFAKYPAAAARPAAM